MEDMKMKGYKEERQQGRRDIKELSQEGEKKKQRKETVPPTCITGKGGTGEVGGVTSIWQLLGLVVKGPWLAPGGSLVPRPSPSFPLLAVVAMGSWVRTWERG